MKTFLLAASALLAICPAFAAGPSWHNDFDGDGKSDLIWRNAETGNNVIWPNAIATSWLGLYGVAGPDWQIAGSGDFNGDGRADILWRNRANGEMWIWYAAGVYDAGLVSRRIFYDWGTDVVEHPDWEIAGIGDFDGDGLSDIFWRNRQSGLNAVGFQFGGRSGMADWGVYTVWYETPVPNLAWKVAGTGDFDGDGLSEILWRNGANGANAVWRFPPDGGPSTTTYLAAVNLAWQIAGIGDFNGDGRADVLWRNPARSANVVWPSADPAAGQRLGTATAAWRAASIADIDGDLRSDIVWRHGVTGANVVWMSGNAASWRYLTPVANQAWQIVP